MGYELHITRSPSWPDATVWIAFEEWRRVVQSDPELEPYDASPEEAGYKLAGNDFDNYIYYDDRCGTINVRPGLLECVRKAVSANVSSATTTSIPGRREVEGEWSGGRPGSRAARGRV